MIRSQLTAETGSGVAIIRTCCEEGGIGSKIGIGNKIGIGGRVGIGGRAGIEASSSKDIFRLSIVYSRGVGE